jgi:2-succinyl-5-enolpyruvyl-6-hydroxy-3-cyclohexene-1-carboxylate synthase
MNPSTAFGRVFVDELIRCGVREAVLAPGSRSAPLAMALLGRAGGDGAGQPGLRLHLRIDERSAAFLGLGLAKASRRPVVVACTSGTAAAHFHAAVIEADEAGLPLIVLTADRPPELRSTGASQTVDQLKLYGSAVRWFCEAGVAEERTGMVRYWRSLACRAWSAASGAAGGFPGPVHVNIPFRDPLLPDSADAGGLDAGGAMAAGDAAGPSGWPEPLDGRPGGAPWTGCGPRPAAAPLPVDWTERGVVVCGGGDYDPAPLVELAEAAGWPVLAEPSSNARYGPNALSAYGYLLDSPAFLAGHRPDVIVSAGRPGLSRGVLAFLRGAPGPVPARHVVLAQGPGRWADPARTATEVAAAVRLSGPAPEAGQHSPWLAAWRRADTAARRAADAVLDADESVTEPRLARDLSAALPDGALLWAGSSLPVRDLEQQMSPRGGLRVLCNRGANGIDGLVSSATGAALAHQAAGGGPAFALIGDLAFQHDHAGLLLGPAEPRPDLCIIVVNNDGGGIFSTLEQAAFPGSFERLFGTPHGSDLALLTRAGGLEHTLVDKAAGLEDALRGTGLRVVEVRTDRTAGAQLRGRLRDACAAAAAAAADAADAAGA